jgi:hypothetical protein
MHPSFPLGDLNVRIAADAGAAAAASTPEASNAEATLNRLIDSAAYMPDPHKRPAARASSHIAGNPGVRA